MQCKTVVFDSEIAYALPFLNGWQTKLEKRDLQPVIAYDAPL